MKRKIPDVVLEAPAHSLVLVPGDAEVDFYVREDEFMLARYPQHCAAEFMLHHWADEKVIAIVLLVRLAGMNVGTFESWINAAKPDDLRLLQLLATQKTIDLYIVSDQISRSLRERNPLTGKAAGYVATMRVRQVWEDEVFEERREQLAKLYPTSDALWRGCREQRR